MKEQLWKAYLTLKRIVVALQAPEAQKVQNVLILFKPVIDNSNRVVSEQIVIKRRHAPDRLSNHVNMQTIWEEMYSFLEASNRAWRLAYRKGHKKAEVQSNREYSSSSQLVKARIWQASLSIQLFRFFPYD